MRIDTTENTSDASLHQGGGHIEVASMTTNRIFRSVGFLDELSRGFAKSREEASCLSPGGRGVVLQLFEVCVTCWMGGSRTCAHSAVWEGTQA